MFWSFWTWTCVHPNFWTGIVVWRHPIPKQKLLQEFPSTWCRTLCLNKVSSWGSSSDSAGLYSKMTMQVSSVDADTTALSLIRCRDRYPKFLVGAEREEGVAGKGAASRGWVTRAQGISSSLYFFLYYLRILSFKVSICIARWFLYNSMK